MCADISAALEQSLQGTVQSQPVGRKKAKDMSWARRAASVVQAMEPLTPRALQQVQLVPHLSTCKPLMSQEVANQLTARAVLFIHHGRHAKPAVLDSLPPLTATTCHRFDVC